ncbi:MAG TPA: hypothetical protein VNN73_13215 [Blastocatellia bacterium]|nr:hypothetical protein [Blastocatellia bacterium]
MAHDDTHHDDELPDVSYIKNADVSHEESDVRIRPIAWFMIGLVVAVAIIHLLMAGLYGLLEKRERKEEKPSPFAAERNPIPPEPRLELAPQVVNQPNPNYIENQPLNNMPKLRAREDQILETYGWIDQASGTVHIPIEDAKQLFLQNQKNEAAQTAAKQGTTPPAVQPRGDRRPSRSNSGRWIGKQ